MSGAPGSQRGRSLRLWLSLARAARGPVRRRLLAAALCSADSGRGCGGDAARTPPRCPGDRRAIGADGSRGRALATAPRGPRSPGDVTCSSPLAPPPRGPPGTQAPAHLHPHCGVQRSVAASPSAFGSHHSRSWSGLLPLPHVPRRCQQGEGSAPPHAHQRAREWFAVCQAALHYGQGQGTGFWGLFTCSCPPPPRPGLVLWLERPGEARGTWCRCHPCRRCPRHSRSSRTPPQGGSTISLLSVPLLGPAALQPKRFAAQVPVDRFTRAFPVLRAANLVTWETTSRAWSPIPWACPSLAAVSHGFYCICLIPGQQPSEEGSDCPSGSGPRCSVGPACSASRMLNSCSHSFSSFPNTQRGLWLIFRPGSPIQPSLGGHLAVSGAQNCPDFLHHPELVSVLLVSLALVRDQEEMAPGAFPWSDRIPKISLQELFHLLLARTLRQVLTLS